MLDCLVCFNLLAGFISVLLLHQAVSMVHPCDHWLSMTLLQFVGLLLDTTSWDLPAVTQIGRQLYGRRLGCLPVEEHKSAAAKFMPQKTTCPTVVMLLKTIHADTGGSMLAVRCSSACSLLTCRRKCRGLLLFGQVNCSGAGRCKGFNQACRSKILLATLQ